MQLAEASRRSIHSQRDSREFMTPMPVALKFALITAGAVACRRARPTLIPRAAGRACGIGARPVY
eukprot:4770152-Pleurochrysis_carterae.AAC.2